MEEHGFLPSSTLLAPKPRLISEDDLIETDSSVTNVVIFSTFVVVCGSFASGCCSGYSSPAESGIMEELGLSTAAYSVFGSILTVGGIIGSLVNGKVADLLGRRGAMWLSQLFFTVGWLSIAFSKGVWALDLGRLSLGIGIGIIAYVVPIYIAETTPKHVRGSFTTANQFMLCCGLSLTFFLGTFVNWRILAIIGAVPCIIQVVGLFFIPESPRWLAKVGRDKELEAALQRFRGGNADISREAADIKDYTETFQSSSENRILDLFQKRYADSLCVGVGLMVVQQLGGEETFSRSSLGKPSFNRLLLGGGIRKPRAGKKKNQALLTNMAAKYAVYHRPEGLKPIVERVHGLTGAFALWLKNLGTTEVQGLPFYDTLKVKCADANAIADAAYKR